MLLPFQQATKFAADGVQNALKPDEGPVAAETYAILQREKQGLQNQLVAASARAADLEQEVKVLTATRLWEVGGQRIGARGQLLPANVVAGDMLPWRDSQLIDSGSRHGVKPGLPVTSRHFTIDQGSDQGVRDGLAILRAEALIGFVEYTGMYASQVKLLSDVSVGMKVRIGRLRDGKFVSVDRFFWLVGQGQGVMRIRDVERRDIEAGNVAVGDIVLSDHTMIVLPAPLVIGTIAAIEPDRQNPLLAMITAKSTVDAEVLHQVYVFDPTPSSEK